MDFDSLIKTMNPDIYMNLKRSLELGKWPDSRLLEAEQKEICMQAIIAYEAENLVCEEERTGHIPKRGPTSCETDKEEASLQSLKWTQD
jgi:uncharacterized protein YeaC (DUF1315 family)